MPELPQMETYKNVLNKKVVGQDIKTIDVTNSKVIKKTTQKALLQHSRNQRIKSLSRYGKMLFFTLDNGYSIVIHLGLRGKLLFTKTGDKPAKDTDSYPISITFKTGDTLQYRTLFGNLTLAENIKAFISAEKLGPDVMAISQADFIEAFTSTKSGNIKQVLMDQHKMAGLGNIYTDEILFQARLDPRTPVKALAKKDIQNLYKQTQQVLNEGVKAKGTWNILPETYMTRHRKKDMLCPVCGDKLEIARVAGRSSYFCTHCQVNPAKA